MTCIIPHPGAASAVLKAVNERKHTFYHATGPVKIQILDKYMAILCYDVVVDDNEFTDYFQLWAWKADKDFKFFMQFNRFHIPGRRQISPRQRRDHYCLLFCW